MKNKFKFLLLAPALLLTACGYGLKEIYEGSVYNSVDYYQNFYRDWSKNINYHEDKSKVDNIDATVYQLDKNEDLVFEKFTDSNFAIIQPDYEQYSYPSDI